MTRKNELKPCPFCGDENPYVYWIGGIGKDALWEVICDNRKLDCDATGPAMSTESEAVDAWNRRI